jgi:predicted metal-binding membrane protein
VSSAPDLTGRVFRHERAILAVSLAALALLCWWTIAAQAGMESAGMGAMGPMFFTGLVIMWWTMMVAMMLPSATPAILLYARVRQNHAGGETIAATWMFAGGYVSIWLLFSIGAAIIQAMLSGSAMTFRSPSLASALFIGAGVYQLSPLKSACLKQCRSPAEFLSRHWRPGPGGAVRLGMLHGAWCVGCCWLLMALLFVGGVMNMLWIFGLAVLVGIEKLVPRGEVFGRATGVALIAWGALRMAF